MNVISTLVRRVPAVSIFAFLLLGISSAAQAQPVEYVQIGYASDDPDITGSWGGQGGAVLGPADGACAAMGALDKVNLLADFGFNLPGDAVITDIAAHVKAGSNGGQNVELQLASDATVDPPTLLGASLILGTTDVGQGNCGSTVVTTVSAPPGSWGVTSANLLAVVNNTTFGLVFTKVLTSNVKVDSVCLEITYTSATGENVQEACFSEPDPESNSITVEKTVVGVVPGSDWAFTGELDPFNLPAAGGFQVFAELADNTYTITETTKAGYEVSVACYSGDTLIASGTNSVDVTVAGDISVTCEFINTSIGGFEVLKDFTDDNAASVSVTVSCTSGTVTNNPQFASESSSAEFDVEGFDAGTTCTATEAVPGGYTADQSDCQDDVINNAPGCTIVNTPIPPPAPETRATFTVQKVFTDGNDETEVTVNIQCFTGVPLNQSATRTASGGDFEVEFVVESFDDGELDCEVWENDVAGYSADYEVTEDNAESTQDSDDGADACEFEDVSAGGDEDEQNVCVITNSPDPVEVEVCKDWVIEGSDGADVDQNYQLTLQCDNPILGENEYYGYWDINFYGEGNNCHTAAVIPDWEGGTNCSVDEDVYDSAVESSNPCGNLDVDIASSGVSCTVTNTVFFEGIPTLSQYGMAILALLMLGVGFVGFRRFV